MNDNGSSPADIAAVIGNRGDGMMGNGGFWIFALIVLAFMGRGGFGWGGGGNDRGGYLTTAESCNMNSFNELKSQVGRMNDMMFTNARQNDNAICTLGYQAADHANATQRQIADCCCELKTAIHEEGEATRNLMQQNKIESLQTQLNDVKMQQMFCGVPRIPTTFTYSVNPANLFNGGCCNNNGTCNTLF